MSHRDSIKTLLSKSQGKGDSVLGEILAQEVDNRLHVEKPETTRMVTRSTKRKRGETLIQQQQKKAKTRKISPIIENAFLGGNPEITNWKPNTSYLMCANVCQISPPSDVQIYPNSPQFISFLIPPDSLGSSEEISAGNQSVLEVTCSVADISFLPLQPNSPRIKKNNCIFPAFFFFLDEEFYRSCCVGKFSA